MQASVCQCTSACFVDRIFRHQPVAFSTQITENKVGFCSHWSLENLIISHRSLEITEAQFAALPMFFVYNTWDFSFIPVNVNGREWKPKAAHPKTKLWELLTSQPILEQKPLFCKLDTCNRHTEKPYNIDGILCQWKSNKLSSKSVTPTTNFILLYQQVLDTKVYAGCM